MFERLGLLAPRLALFRVDRRVCRCRSGQRTSKQQSDDGGAYRLTREDSQPQPQTSAQDQPAQDTPAEEAVDAPSRRRRANRKPADAPSEDE